MKAKNLYPFSLTGLMFLVAQQLFAKYIMWFGFRDKFAAELDVAEHTLAIWFVWFSLAMAVLFLGLGVLSFRIEIKKPLAYACIVFLFAATAAVALDLYFRSYMVDSAGG
jgi:hypothetical protein